MINARGWIALGLLSLCAGPALAQSFRVQCPSSTITHPSAPNNNAEPTYLGPTTFTSTNSANPAAGYLVPSGNVNGAIKCQQISGGDGYATMADGTQTFMFSFGPLSGLADIAAGLPGTEFPSIFNQTYQDFLNNPNAILLPGDPATTDGAAAYATPGWGSGGTPEYSAGSPAFAYNGAVGLALDVPFVDTIYDISESGNVVTVVLNAPSGFAVGDKVVISGTGTGYDNTKANPTWIVSATNVANPFFSGSQAFRFIACTQTTPTLSGCTTGLAEVTESPTATAASLPRIDGHVDPRQITDVGVMNGNIPAPLMAFDEDDEFFLTLSNVGMIMRPDLFEQHTVHFHGYPNASALYDGVPDASVAINIGGSFTYYYLAPDAGTYFWHCHITPPEHLQMGMVGQLYVRPRQNRVPVGNSLYSALQAQQTDLRTACNSAADILCSNPLPADAGILPNQTSATAAAGVKYAYNDGDGSTAYDVEYPLQIHGFDPNFHFVGMTFNPEAFVDMKDKYFLLNGRSYPDTTAAGPQQTQSSDGRVHYSQPLNSVITIPHGGRALLRISDLDVSEYQTLASLGIRMHVIGYNAKLLRDQAGNNLDYYTNSITLGGGESLDVILDACSSRSGNTCNVALPAGTYYLYTPNLDHLSNDAENFGGLMTVVQVL